MNELNSGKIKITKDGNIIMQFSNYHHVIDSDTELYYKHQADKVIAEKDKKIAELKECAKNLILDNYLQDKEIRHHKHKRCLAMAELCCERKENCYICIIKLFKNQIFTKISKILSKNAIFKYLFAFTSFHLLSLIFTKFYKLSFKKVYKSVHTRKKTRKHH